MAEPISIKDSIIALNRRRSDYMIGLVTPAIRPNISKKLTRLVSSVHNRPIRGKVWIQKQQYGFTDKLLSVKPCMMFFIQSLPRRPIISLLCAGAVSRVSFLDLFGAIAGVTTSPIMLCNHVFDELPQQNHILLQMKDK